MRITHFLTALVLVALLALRSEASLFSGKPIDKKSETQKYYWHNTVTDKVQVSARSWTLCRWPLARIHKQMRVGSPPQYDTNILHCTLS